MGTHQPVIDTPPVGATLHLIWDPEDAGDDDYQGPVQVTVLPLPDDAAAKGYLPGEFDVTDDGTEAGAWTVMHMDVARGVTWVVDG